MALTAQYEYYQIQQEFVFLCLECWSRKLKDVQGKEQFSVEVSNRFAALEDLDTEVEINSAWETIRENIKTSAEESLGYFELKKHKPWFHKGCSKLLDQRK
jgi:hypothetical protein